MAMIEINKEPSRRDLAVFGWLLLLFSVLVGGLVLRRSDSMRIATVVWSIGLALTLVYYAVPSTRRPVFLAWMYAAYPIGWTISHLIMGVIYYLLVTPIGLALRLSGKRPLDLEFDRSATTYWEPHETGQDVTRYFRQF